jgi:hypothetical protein
VGVVSERDIARGVILQHRASVREIMTTRVHGLYQSSPARRLHDQDHESSSRP